MKLTKTQINVLQRLANDEDLVYEKGAGWWFGNERTNGQLAQFLIRNILVSCDDFGKQVEHYSINESGRLALAGKEKIYRISSGELVATLREAVRHR